MDLSLRERLERVARERARQRRPWSNSHSSPPASSNPNGESSREKLPRFARAPNLAGRRGLEIRPRYQRKTALDYSHSPLTRRVFPISERPRYRLDAFDYGEFPRGFGRRRSNHSIPFRLVRAGAAMIRYPRKYLALL